MPERMIAIGDIHGCSRALDRLLQAIQPQRDDTVITLGDYVDRGPGSRQVLNRLMTLAEECTLIPLCGNHEILLLESIEDEGTFEFWRQCGGDQTLESYGGRLANLPADHIEFLENLRPYHETADYLFVHANYDPRRPLSETPESVLYWQHLTTSPPPPHVSGKVAIVGHTPQANGEVLNWRYLLCLDTYCFGGGWLSALEMNTGRLWQTNERGELRSGVLRS